MVYKKRIYKKKELEEEKPQVATKTWVSKQLKKSTNEQCAFLEGTDNDWQPTELITYQLGSSIDKGLTGVDGVSRGNRIGDKIYHKSFHMLLRARSTSEIDRMYIRVLLVKNNRPLSSNATNLFLPESNENSPVDFGGGALIQIYKPVNTQKFHVYYDRVFELGPNTASAGKFDARVFDIKIPTGFYLKFNTESNADSRVSPDIECLYYLHTQRGIGSLPAGTVSRTVHYREYFNA